MDDIKWHMDKLLDQPLTMRRDISRRYSLQLLEQVLVLVQQLMSLETIGLKNEIGETSLNHDDENRSLL